MDVTAVMMVRLRLLVPHIVTYIELYLIWRVLGFIDMPWGWEFAVRQTLDAYPYGITVLAVIRLVTGCVGLRCRIAHWLLLALAWPAWWWLWLPTFGWADRHHVIMSFIVGTLFAISVDVAEWALTRRRWVLALAGLGHQGGIICLTTVAGYFFDVDAPSITPLGWWWAGLGFWATAVLIATGSAIAFDGFDGWRPRPAGFILLGLALIIYGLITGPATFSALPVNTTLRPAPFTVIGASEVAGGLAVLLGAMCGWAAIFYRPAPPATTQPATPAWARIAD